MPHGRDLVVTLQQAHADHIESIYAGLQRIPGNPRQIEIDLIGSTRIFLADQDRMENRAIITGNESTLELEQIAARFARKKRTCFIELNPANFLQTEPFSWNSEMMPALINLGFKPDAFRCVWYLDEPLPASADSSASPQLDVFSRADIAHFIPLRLAVSPVDAPRQPAEIEELSQGQASAGWFHYVGYENGAPASTSSLFIHQELGYLKWGFTRHEYRNRGHQKAHIRRRIRDAFAHGCKGVFCVTDFETPSGDNLQKCGLKLAYNYVLMVKARAS